ncbi:MAG: type 1 glutamine amidotransferase domain-containing protein [Zoogloea sp.]|uniref:type 1 glutamine amidotransferase domain-containing protein n=1 Tax=Zoogloea sp. TaxID=49181 RepID=UPI003F3B5486
MSNAVRVLMILTSHASLGDGGASTGVWFEELTTPYYAFVDAGVPVDIASIAGGRVPIDPHSLKPAGQNPPSVERFIHDARAMAQIEQTPALAGLHAEAYGAVFMPGGHGTMWDLPTSPALRSLLAEAWQAGKVVAAVCHGPAGLVSVQDPTGQPLVAGRRVSAFSNTEEVAAGLAEVVPFALETRLKALGARYESGPDFEPFALRDGQLVTGQNPASSAAVARLTLEALGVLPVKAP